MPCECVHNYTGGGNKYTNSKFDYNYLIYVIDSIVLIDVNYFIGFERCLKDHCDVILRGEPIGKGEVTY